MSKKLFNIFEGLIVEASTEEEVNEFVNKLEVKNGNAKLYHYTSQKIEDDKISVRGKQGSHSKGEFQVWGKNRSFFYGNKDGIKYDTGVPSDYLYISHMPLNQIYIINANPNNYKAEEGKNRFQSIYEQSTADGYQSFGYYLGNNKNVPIIVAFVDLPINEGYKVGPGGGYIPLEKELLDYRIGTLTDSGQEYIVMQKDGFSKTFGNSYLTMEPDPKMAMKSYKKELSSPVFLWKHIKLDPEYGNVPEYQADLKKYA